jgi:predicted Na+-dependent transporter
MLGLHRVVSTGSTAMEQCRCIELSITKQTIDLSRIMLTLLLFLFTHLLVTYSTVFAKKFNKNEAKVGLGSIAIVIAFIFLCMTTTMILAWYSMKVLFNKEPALRVMGLFGCTQKTIALGIPLITSIFGNSEFFSLYTLPILIWHPMQLVVGSFCVTRLQQFMITEKERLGLTDDDLANNTPNVASPKPATETPDERV